MERTAKERRDELWAAAWPNKRDALACKKEGWETMNQEIVIRKETQNDMGPITELTIAAFKTLGRSATTRNSSSSRRCVPLKL